MTPRIRVHLSDRGSRRSLQLQRQFVDRWRYHVVRRYLRDAKMLQRLPWFAWCWACAWNGASVVSALGERSSHPLRFVQIGAHDVDTNDPLHATVVSHNWTGVAVEAVPAIYERLCANYAEIPGVACSTHRVRYLGTAVPRCTASTIMPADCRLRADVSPERLFIPTSNTRVAASALVTGGSQDGGLRHAKASGHTFIMRYPWR